MKRRGASHQGPEADDPHRPRHGLGLPGALSSVFLKSPGRTKNVRRRLCFGDVAGRRGGVRARRQTKKQQQQHRQTLELVDLLRRFIAQEASNADEQDEPRGVEALYNELLEDAEESVLSPAERLRKARWADGHSEEHPLPRNVLEEFRDLARRGQVRIDFHAPELNLPEGLLRLCVDLTEQNMTTQYREHPEWAWDRAEKVSQLSRPGSRFLVLTDETLDRFVGFANFHFTCVDDAAALHVYELQLAPEVSGAGLDSHCMSLLEKVAGFWDLERVMLSCFRADRAFYSGLGYSEDKTSPAGKSHVILSKKL